jgi:hypothetical protein
MTISIAPADQFEDKTCCLLPPNSVLSTYANCREREREKERERQREEKEKEKERSTHWICGLKGQLECRPSHTKEEK